MTVSTVRYSAKKEVLRTGVNLSCFKRSYRETGVRVGFMLWLLARYADSREETCRSEFCMWSVSSVSA